MGALSTVLFLFLPAVVPGATNIDGLSTQRLQLSRFSLRCSAGFQACHTADLKVRTPDMKTALPETA
jgi:hypothetical protein